MYWLAVILVELNPRNMWCQKSLIQKTSLKSSEFSHCTYDCDASDPTEDPIKLILFIQNILELNLLFWFYTLKSKKIVHNAVADFLSKELKL